MSDEYQCVMPFWIDTDGYTDRDRKMFVAGFEFCQVLKQLESGWTGERPIHQENSSRIRMAARRLGRITLHIEPHTDYEGCETWAHLTVTDNGYEA